MFLATTLGPPGGWVKVCSIPTRTRAGGIGSYAPAKVRTRGINVGARPRLQALHSNAEHALLLEHPQLAP